MDLYRKHGYTLAEIMVVLLVLTIIFAAFAPLITKRRASSNRSKYAVWNWAQSSELGGPMNAFYYPGDTNYTGTAFFGLTPESEEDARYLVPNSRVVIRSLSNIGNGDVQRQIQFRYGRDGLNASNKPNSSFAGSMLLDTRNILVGGRYNELKYDSDSKKLPKNNIALGYMALDSITSGTANVAKNNVAIGYNAGKSVTSAKDNTYIGYNAGKSSETTIGQTFIGSNAGAENKRSYSTAVGYYAGYNSTGTGNTYIGAEAGYGNGNNNYNFGVGAGALRSISTGEYNTAIGYNALSSLTTGSYNVAIGYNACSQVTTGSYKTCIGYNSGPKTTIEHDDKKQRVSDTKTTSEAFLNATTDNVQRTYIGSTPYNFGGDAVLEIHNPSTFNIDLQNDPAIKSNTTTVINGNLIVRGRLFFTTGNKLQTILNNISVSFSGTDIASGLGIRDNSDFNCTANQASYSWTSGRCPNLASDRRLKNIGSRNNDGLNKISQLKIFNYTFKDDKDKKPQVGVMAQDLQRVFPNAVSKGDDGFLKIRWDDMFYAAVNAIKELDKKIISMVTRITDLEPKITKLEEQNKELKLQVAQLTSRIEKLKSK